MSVCFEATKEDDMEDDRSSLRMAGHAMRFSGRVGWQLIRVPLVAFLALVEPVISFCVMGIALLGVLMSLFFRYVVALPNFPFVLMMGLSIGLASCLVPLNMLIRRLSR
jgi:hypothetical protein